MNPTKELASLRVQIAAGESQACALGGARQDAQSITADWTRLQEPLSGVEVREVKAVPKEDGYLTEIYRRDWGLLPNSLVDQVFQVVLEPGVISAWHAHRSATDRLFVSHGLVKLVLYDARADADTFGSLNVFRFGSVRPALVVVPPGVWHGLENLSAHPSVVINLVDRAYEYANPDHWRLPWNTQDIPYQFGARRMPAGA